jgi:hypothetical protein
MLREDKWYNGENSIFYFLKDRLLSKENNLLFLIFLPATKTKSAVATLSKG